MKSTARLHVIFARNASLALVFRRGPSKQVATMLWNRKNDTFKMGQWFKGRIYEHRSDLSPDGKYFVYFAHKMGAKRGGPHVWTAVSKAPYLKAISFYEEMDTWVGGGYFLGRNLLQLNRGVFHNPRWEDKNIRIASVKMARNIKDRIIPFSLGVYYARLNAMDWQLVQLAEQENGPAYDLFEKKLRHGWKVQKQLYRFTKSPAHKRIYGEEHLLIPPNDGLSIPCPDWEWMEEDKKRIVWASDGCLWQSEQGKKGPKNPQLLYDFNDMKFEPIKAPY